MAKKTLKNTQKINSINISKINIILSVIIIIFPIIIYVNSIQNGFVLDDFSLIKENLVTQKGFDGIKEHIENTYRYGYWNKQDNIYRPLPMVLFAIEWQLFPDNPFPGHLVNILLYSLTGFVLFKILQKLFKQYSIFLSFIITLLFLAHPIHTEVVANIKSVDEILAFLLSFTTILLLLKYIEFKKVYWLITSVIIFFFSFTAKESTIMFLGIIPLVLYFFTNLKIKNIIIYTSIYLIPTIIFLIIRQKIIGAASANDVSVIDNLLVATNSFNEKSATAILILGKYLLLLVFPISLAADYSFNQIPIVDWSNFKAIFSLLVFLTTIYIAIKGLRKKTILSFSIFFFLISISLYTNLIITIGSSFAERFMYLASLGFISAIVYSLYNYLKFDVTNLNLSASEFFKSKITIFLLIVIVLFSIKTIQRNTEWKSDLTLYSADILKSPNSAHMRYYYGLSVMKDLALNAENETEKTKYLNEAIKNFNIAKEIYPSYADAYEQLGLAYFRLNDYKNSFKNYEISLKYNPYNSVTYSNLGVIYFHSQQFSKALEVYKKAVELNPKNVDALFNLGSTYGTIQQFEDAIKTFKKVVELNPNHATAYYYIGITYNTLKNKSEALKYCKIANKLDSKFAIPADINAQ